MRPPCPIHAGVMPCICPPIEWKWEMPTGALDQLREQVRATALREAAKARHPSMRSVTERMTPRTPLSMGPSLEVD